MSIFRADIALIGLAVMGQNIILNMNDHGFVVSLAHVDHKSSSLLTHYSHFDLPHHFLPVTYNCLSPVFFTHVGLRVQPDRVQGARFPEE